jgi:hypothetical protein
MICVKGGSSASALSTYPAGKNTTAGVTVVESQPWPQREPAVIAALRGVSAKSHVVVQLCVLDGRSIVSHAIALCTIVLGLCQPRIGR